QVRWRVRVDVRHLRCAIAVPRPEFPARGYQHSVRSWPVREGGPAAARQGPSHTAHPTDEKVALGVDDVHAEVRSVREIVPFGSRINPGNVRARDGVARHRDHTNEADGSFHIVLVMLTLAEIAI